MNVGARWCHVTTSCLRGGGGVTSKLTLSHFVPHLYLILFEYHNSANSGPIFMIPPLTNVLIA
jgi:hypothetical protein